jgi:electron transfer flavoprotein alpha subunit
MSAHKDSGGVMVFVEFRRNHIRRGSIQLIGEGRRIADILGVELSGVLLGHDIEEFAEEAIQYGLDRLYLVDNPILSNYTTGPYSKAMVELVKKHKPEILLIAATKNGRELGGRFYVYLAHIMCRKTRPQMATARPNVFPEPERDPDRSGEIVREEVKLGPEDMDSKMIRFIAHIESEETRLSDASIVIAGGHGTRKAGTFDDLQELAELLGGTVGGTRKVVDLHWLPKERQVGQTGKTIRPKLYVAVGISGAVQHLSGMQESEKIVAINNDAEAEIFRIADFGIVGDLFEIIPEMVRQIKERRASPT